jgi:hypothetical protein
MAQMIAWTTPEKMAVPQGPAKPGSATRRPVGGEVIGESAFADPPGGVEDGAPIELDATTIALGAGAVLVAIGTAWYLLR